MGNSCWGAYFQKAIEEFPVVSMKCRGVLYILGQKQSYKTTCF